MFDSARRIMAVICLTLLIWFWAYFRLEEQVTKWGTLNISPVTSPSIFVSFVDGEAPVRIQMELKGSAARISDLQKMLQADDTDPDKERLDFYFDVETEQHAEPGSYPLDVLQFLKNSKKIKDLGLVVEDCNVKSIEFKVEKLTEQMLTVRCVDENGTAMEYDSIEPGMVKIFVRRDYIGEATVSLTAQQIEKARKEPVTGKPYVELAPGARRYADSAVVVKLVSTALEDKVLQGTIGFIYSQGLSGEYRPELLNENDFRTIHFKATEKAYLAYNDMNYHILIEIRDGDEKNEGEISRQITFNFPPEYVRKGEIVFSGQDEKAKFKLVPVSAGAPAP